MKSFSNPTASIAEEANYLIRYIQADSPIHKFEVLNQLQQTHLDRAYANIPGVNAETMAGYFLRRTLEFWGAKIPPEYKVIQETKEKVRDIHARHYGEVFRTPDLTDEQVAETLLQTALGGKTLNEYLGLGKGKVFTIHC